MLDHAAHHNIPVPPVAREGHRHDTGPPSPRVDPLSVNAFLTGEQEVAAAANSVVTVPFPAAAGLSLGVALCASTVSWRPLRDGNLARRLDLDVALVSALTHPLDPSASDGSRVIVDPGPGWSPGAAVALGASQRLVTDG